MGSSDFPPISRVSFQMHPEAHYPLVCYMSGSVPITQHSSSYVTLTMLLRNRCYYLCPPPRFFSLQMRKLRLRVSNLQEVIQTHGNEIGVRTHFVQLQSLGTSPHDLLPNCHTLRMSQGRITKENFGSGDLRLCARVCASVCGRYRYLRSFLFSFLSLPPRPPPLCTPYIPFAHLAGFLILSSLVTCLRN